MIEFNRDDYLRLESCINNIYTFNNELEKMNLKYKKALSFVDIMKILVLKDRCLNLYLNDEYTSYMLLEFSVTYKFIDEMIASRDLEPTLEYILEDNSKTKAKICAYIRDSFNN